MTERRRFGIRQRRALFRRSGGRCARCDTPLDVGWHADHVAPHALGGPTLTSNGQALCPPCNLLKGTTVAYNDTFRPRPFQADVIEAVLDGFATGRKTTVALGTPGTGKTLAYQATATQLIREGLIDYVAVFVPRVTLAQQCETSWMHQDRKTKELHGLHGLFDARARLGKIRHMDANPPFTRPGETGTGFVSCYASLVRAEIDYLDWAREHEGRFLLVADEAQFCGARDDDRGGGTEAGRVVKEMHAYAAHTLLLTGTPYRADGRKLILADYGDLDTDGKQLLIRQVEATYEDGIEEGYLRRFEMQMHDGWVTETDVAGEFSTRYRLSKREASLKPIMRLPSTWQPLTDRVVQAVKEKQILNPDYRGLISCMERRDAEAVRDYLAAVHPELRVYIAVSSDGAAAQKALQDFKDKPADILVTVRMAFIGYDCPKITVVGVLTHYRDPGHLMQLIGRGLRTWDAEPSREQSCRVIAPDDPRMQAFLAMLKEQSEEGVRRRKERDGDTAGPGEGPSFIDELTVIEKTELDRERRVSPDIELDHDELMLYEAIKAKHGSSIDTTMFAAMVADLGMRLTNPNPTANAASQAFDEPAAAPRPEPPREVLTDKQQIERINAETAEVVRDYLATRGIRAGHPEYSMYIGKVTSRVNAASRKAAQVRTVEDAEQRLAAARRLCGAS
ncbi:DEAD/DEAH box helicase family protein [Actinomadura sediminis]|uniref:DEAD/DEAH box helicase family protein n=1 Tax=Actinomadura sediminis TaxID=1038904 RepID=A0ABW3EPS5_9ACTN